VQYARGFLLVLVGALACQPTTPLPQGLEDDGKGSPPPSGSTPPPTTDSGLTISDGGGVATVLASGVQTPTSLALGATSIYWTDVAGGVWSVARTGGTPAQIASGQNAPTSIAVNAGLSTLYWVNAGGPTGGGAIVSFNLSTNVLTNLTTNLSGPYGIASNSQDVYFTAESASQPGVDVTQVPVAGGAALEIGTVVGGFVAGGLAIDTENAYFASYANGGGGSVSTVPLLGGGQPDTLWETAAAGPTDVVVEGSALYWLVPGTATSGAVWTVSLPGGKPVAMVTGLDSPKHLAVDDANAYWTSPVTGEVLALPLGDTDGGLFTPVVLATGLTAPTALAVDDAVYVTTSSTVVSVPK